MAEGESLKTCPQCGTQTEQIQPIESGMRLALTTSGLFTSLPDRVCSNCYESLSSKVSQGFKLQMESKNREQNKIMLWKSRVNLIKQARGLMAQRAYSEAAVGYEKYIRVLEIVYNVRRGELTPDVFNKSRRSKEMTVLTSVYWDLLRIYDTSPRYGNRMQATAKKLAQFLPFTTLYPDIAKKCDGLLRTAKNPDVVRSFMKEINAGGPGCFVATAAFESRAAPEVLQLRNFRDTVLRRFALGRKFIRLYYRHSPPLANKLINRPFLRIVVRCGLRALCAILSFIS